MGDTKAARNVGLGIGGIWAPGLTKAKRAKWRLQLIKNRRMRADLNREFAGEGARKSPEEFHRRLRAIALGSAA